MGEGDFFWDANGRNQFPKVAEDVDAQLTQYKQVLLSSLSIHAKTTSPKLQARSLTSVKQRLCRYNRCWQTKFLQPLHCVGEAARASSAELHAGRGWSELETQAGR